MSEKRPENLMPEEKTLEPEDALVVLKRGGEQLLQPLDQRLEEIKKEQEGLQGYELAKNEAKNEAEIRKIKIKKERIKEEIKQEIKNRKKKS